MQRRPLSFIRLVENDDYYVVAVSNWDRPDTIPVRRRRSLAERSASSEAIREARTVHLVDLMEPDALRRYPDTKFIGQRTVLHVPLVREGRAIGQISLGRSDVQAFSPAEIALLETFADQAVIAIENARLFEELEQRNARARAEALEQQTATAEVLRVIASSPTDAQPVLDAVAESAVRLSRSVSGQSRFVRATSCGSSRRRVRASSRPTFPGTLLDLSRCIRDTSRRWKAERSTFQTGRHPSFGSSSRRR